MLMMKNIFFGFFIWVEIFEGFDTLLLETDSGW
jgi:hypothetical protein